MKLCEELNKEVKMSTSEAIDNNTYLGGYLNALLFVGTDEEDNPLDDEHDIDDIDKDSVKKSEKDIAKFLKMAKKELEGIEADDSQIGHDILMTRQGTGVGFLDRDYADDAILKKLDGYADKLGSVSPFAENGTVGID